MACSWARARASASLGASAQTWVTGSSGSGTTRVQPSGSGSLTPSTRIDVAALGPLHRGAHDGPLLLPGRDHLLVGDVDGRQPARQLRQALAGAGQHAEQMDEGGHGVEGGEEAGEDEAPHLAGGEGRPPRRSRPP